MDGLVTFFKNHSSKGGFESNDITEGELIRHPIIF